MSRAPLDYETPRPTDAAKRKYGRYATAAFLIGVAVGFLLAFAIKWALVAGTVHHIGWISRLGPSSRTLIGTAALCAPILIAACSIHRVQKKLLGAELAAKAAEERRLLEEEMAAAVWWKVPKSADAAEWPKVLLITGASYTATFVLVLAFIPLGLLLDWLKPPQGGAHEDMSPLHVAFYSANVVGMIGPTLFILLLVLPRARVTLVSHGVVHRGGRKTLIPWYVGFKNKTN